MKKYTEKRVRLSAVQKGDLLKDKEGSYTEVNSIYKQKEKDTIHVTLKNGHREVIDGDPEIMALVLTGLTSL